MANSYTNITEDVEIINHCYGFADSLAIRSAVELRIADIIHSNGHPMTVPELASKLESKSPNVLSLARVMRALARKNIFTITYPEEKNEPVYGLTRISNRLRHDCENSSAHMFLALTQPANIAAWHKISRSITEGGTPFEVAHGGESFWEKSSKDVEFNDRFNKGMAVETRNVMNAILEGYKDGFGKLEGTLVDVGGGTGGAVAEIVKAFPHIEGINFDLPHVVDTAPSFPGVTHVGGDIFNEIPKGDNILLKNVLHDWGDEDCIKILKNIKKALHDKKGKVIIVEMVLQSDGEQLLENAKIVFDLFMMTHFNNAKERSEDDWKKYYLMMLNLLVLISSKLMLLHPLLRHCLTNYVWKK